MHDDYIDMKADSLQLKSGTRLYLQRGRMDGVTEVMPCILLHSIEARVLVVRPLRAENLSPFIVGETYSTRIAGAGKHYSFETTILAKLEAQHLEIHLSYPKESSDAYIRKAPRFLVSKPIRLSLRFGDKSITVHAHDISTSGACLIAETSLAKGADILNIELRDPFNTSLITLHCLVRYVMFDIIDGVINYRHGVEFQFRDSDEQLQLENFIEYLLHEGYAVPLSTL